MMIILHISDRVMPKKAYGLDNGPLKSTEEKRKYTEFARNLLFPVIFKIPKQHLPTPGPTFFSVWVTAGSASSLVDSTQLSNTPELIWVYCERIGIAPGLRSYFSGSRFYPLVMTNMAIENDHRNS